MAWEDQMEKLLKKEFRRLLEILGDLGSIGKELENSAERINPKGPQEELAKQLVDEIKLNRIQGFCAYQLLQEAMILVYLITLKIWSLRLFNNSTNDPKKLTELKEYEQALKQIEPTLRETLEALKVFSKIEGKELLESIVSAYKHPA